MKAGLDWFPLDVRNDTKLDLIEAEFHLKGFALVIKMFQLIYADTGYCTHWHDEVALLFASKNGVSGKLVSEIVSAAIRRDIFDKAMFDKYGILTSYGIQKRYLSAVARRKDAEIKEEYRIVRAVEKKEVAYISSENAYISDENDDIFKQSRVEKSRVRSMLSSTRETDGLQTTHSPASLFCFSEIVEYCREHAPVIYGRHARDPSGDSRLYAALDALGDGVTAADIKAAISHAAKTYHSKPKFAGCGLAYIVENLEKVMAAEECGQTDGQGGGNEKEDIGKALGFK
jgi:hypothetical protein